ncbi:hypothetical protein ScPMuIL_001850 [Solemya velum]
MVWRLIPALVVFTYFENGASSYEGSRMFTISNTVKTWNEAAAICKDNEQLLLKIPNSDSWEMWKAILHPHHHTDRRQNANYWVGLFAPDTSDPEHYVWADCQDPTWLEWADRRGPTEPCIYMIPYKEVYIGYVVRAWYFDKCDKEFPFVCETAITDCFPEQCDELVTPNLSDKECESLCGTYATFSPQCSHHLDSGAAFCHVKLGDYQFTGQYTICFLQDTTTTLPPCGTGSSPLDYTFDGQIAAVPHYTCPEKNFSMTELPPSTTTDTMSTETKIPLIRSSSDPETSLVPQTSLAPTAMTASETSLVSQTSLAPKAVTASETSSVPQTSLAPKAVKAVKEVCFCPCDVVRPFKEEFVNLTVKEIVEKIAKEISVEKTDTSAHIRKQTSAKDHRPSATGLGSLAIVLLTLTFGGIFLLDIRRLKEDICLMISNLSGICGNCAKVEPSPITTPEPNFVFPEMFRMYEDGAQAPWNSDSIPDDVSEAVFLDNSPLDYTFDGQIAAVPHYTCPEKNFSTTALTPSTTADTMSTETKIPLIRSSLAPETSLAPKAVTASETSLVPQTSLAPKAMTASETSLVPQTSLAPKTVTASETSSVPQTSLAPKAVKEVCFCPCDVVRPFKEEFVNLTVQEIVERIAKEISVEKTDTSAHIRKQTSAKDHRPSATGLGSLAIVLLTLTFGGIFLLDIRRLKEDICLMISNLSGICGNCAKVEPSPITTPEPNFVFPEMFRMYEDGAQAPWNSDGIPDDVSEAVFLDNSE